MAAQPFLPLFLSKILIFISTLLLRLLSSLSSFYIFFVSPFSWLLLLSRLYRILLLPIFTSGFVFFLLDVKQFFSSSLWFFLLLHVPDCYYNFKKKISRLFLNSGYYDTARNLIKKFPSSENAHWNWKSKWMNIVDKTKSKKYFFEPTLFNRAISVNIFKQYK